MQREDVSSSSRTTSLSVSDAPAVSTASVPDPWPYLRGKFEQSKTGVSPSRAAELIDEYLRTYHGDAYVACLSRGGPACGQIWDVAATYEAQYKEVMTITDLQKRRAEYAMLARGYGGAIAKAARDIIDSGNEEVARWHVERKGREALRGANPAPVGPAEVIRGKRVRHYTNRDAYPLIVQSDALKVFSDSDQGAVFLMIHKNFPALDNLEPGGIKSTFDIRHNNCDHYLEFNLETGVWAKSRQGNRNFNDKVLKKCEELKVTKASSGARDDKVVADLSRREPVWYRFDSRRWESIPASEYSWGKGRTK